MSNRQGGCDVAASMPLHSTLPCTIADSMNRQRLEKIVDISSTTLIEQSRDKHRV